MIKIKKIVSNYKITSLSKQERGAQQKNKVIGKWNETRVKEKTNATKWIGSSTIKEKMEGKMTTNNFYY